jgi:trehalose 6-phosphate synthase/phosphatase
MENVRPVIETFCDRTPGTFIEEKNYSWPGITGKQIRIWVKFEPMNYPMYLKELISNHGLSVLEGNKVLEIKSSGVNKGKAAGKLLLKKF